MFHFLSEYAVLVQDISHRITKKTFCYLLLDHFSLTLCVFSKVLKEISTSYGAMQNNEKGQVKIWLYVGLSLFISHNQHQVFLGYR